MAIERASSFPDDRELLRDRILWFADAMGVEAAHDLLAEEFENRYEAMERQAFGIDGAWAQEVAEIVKRYPKWNARFIQENPGRLRITLSCQEGDKDILAQEGQMMEREAREAREKYISLKGLRPEGKPLDGEFVSVANFEIQKAPDQE
jgi:hypothetical protein